MVKDDIGKRAETSLCRPLVIRLKVKSDFTPGALKF